MLRWRVPDEGTNRQNNSSSQKCMKATHYINWKYAYQFICIVAFTSFLVNFPNLDSKSIPLRSLSGTHIKLVCTFWKDSLSEFIPIKQSLVRSTILNWSKSVKIRRWRSRLVIQKNTTFPFAGESGGFLGYGAEAEVVWRIPICSVKAGIVRSGISQAASWWGKACAKIHSPSYHFNLIYSLAFLIFILLQITSGKTQICCQLVVIAGFLLSAFPLEPFLKNVQFR